MDCSDLQHIIDLSPTGVIYFDQQGQALRLNKTLCGMLGVSSEQLQHISIEAFEALLAKMAWHKTSKNTEMALFVIAGANPRILKRIKQHNPENSQATFVHYFYDITQESNMDQMKSKVLSMAAHDLRTSLSSIQGYTELLIKRADKNELNKPDSKEFLESMLRQSHQLNHMINDLLDLAKIESQNSFELNTSRHQIKRFVSDAINDFFVARKVKLTPCEQDIWVDLDYPKMGQALQNVFSNAEKYSDPSSDIEVDISYDEMSGMVGISVRDHGIGMTPVQQSQLFSRFYRANPEGDIAGTGLGLCLVKETLEMHAGGVEVNSSYGKGTQVTLWIPAAS